MIKMPVHTTSTETLINFGEVKCFMLHADKSRKAPKLKEKRHVVVSSCKFQNGETRPCSFSLDFYKDTSKYEKRDVKHSASYQELMERHCLCGFTKGHMNNGSRERYISFVFTRFTAIIMLNEFTDDTASKYIQCCEQMCKDHFSHGLTRSIRINSYPENSRKILKKEETGRILLGVTEHRLSIISETHHHKCLYSWDPECVDIDLSSSVLHIEVKDSEIGSGSYTFVSSHAQTIAERLLDTMNKYSVIESSCISPPPDVCKTVRRPSQDSCQSAPLTPPSHAARMYFHHRSHPLNSQSSEDSFCGATARLPLSNPEENVYLESKITRVESVECDDVYLTTCHRCSLMYSEYMNSNDIDPEHANSSSEESHHECGMHTLDRQESSCDDYALDLNEYVEQHKDKVTTVLQSHDGLGKKYMKTCHSTFTDSYDDSCTSSAQSSGNSVVQACLPCEGKYLIRTQTSELSLLCPPSSPASQISETDTENHSHVEIRKLEIFQTLDRVLRHKLPRKTTLQLDFSVRCELCMRLYLPSVNSVGTCMEDWQLLGEKIGLCVDAINLISAIVKNHCLPYPAAEVVLRHWQFVYNKYGSSGQDYRCPYPCNNESLLKILREMRRADLEELIQNDSPSNLKQQQTTF